MELTVAGMDPFQMSPLQKKLYSNFMSDQREARLLELIIIVNSIKDVGARLAGHDAGSGTKDAFKAYKELLFPEFREDTDKKAKKTADILKQEFDKGPMQVQALSYGKGKPKKRREKRL